MQRHRKFSAVLGTVSAYNCKTTRLCCIEAQTLTAHNHGTAAVQIGRCSLRQTHNYCSQRTSMTILPAGVSPILVSKKTVGLPMVKKVGIDAM